MVGHLLLSGLFVNGALLHSELGQGDYLPPVGGKKPEKSATRGIQLGVAITLACTFRLVEARMVGEISRAGSFHSQ
jgi:hypothetical protein